MMTAHLRPARFHALLADVTVTSVEVDPPTASLALWATVHGLVSLHLRGLHPTDAPAPATVVDVALRAVVAGWLAAPRHCHDGHLRAIEPTF